MGKSPWKNLCFSTGLHIPMLGALSPPGRGYDCGRTWQVLALGSIPFLVRTHFWALWTTASGPPKKNRYMYRIIWLQRSSKEVVACLHTCSRVRLLFLFLFGQDSLQPIARLVMRDDKFDQRLHIGQGLRTIPGILLVARHGWLNLANFWVCLMLIRFTLDSNNIFHYMCIYICI